MKILSFGSKSLLKEYCDEDQMNFETNKINGEEMNELYSFVGHQIPENTKQKESRRRKSAIKYFTRSLGFPQFRNSTIVVRHFK